MKVSFIICYSSTWPMTVFDKECWPEPDLALDKKILKQTNNLIKQILGFQGMNKEVILVDNSDDFVCELSGKDADDHLRIIKRRKHYSERIDDTNNQAKVTAEAYNIGLSYVTGTHICIQHNDTQYLTQYYPYGELFVDLDKTLNDFDLEYISIDAKPGKVPNQEGTIYADCYWFFCRHDFYLKNNIDVDYKKGDNNHQATITCIEKDLKFLHLPGFHEVVGLGMNYKIHLRRNYPGLSRLDGNVHSFLDIPFLYHYKGGTGLKSLIIKNDITD